MLSPNDPLQAQSQHTKRATRRRVLASAAALGVTSLSLPTSVMAASGAGPAGSYSFPGELALTNPDTTPQYNGHPIGGYWWKNLDPAGWAFEIPLSRWSLPIDDSGKTAPPFAYDYQLSPNNGVSWHTMTWNAGWNAWALIISFDVIAETSAGSPRAVDSPYFFTEPNDWAPAGYNFLYNVLLRAVLAETVVDQSSTFWLA